MCHVSLFSASLQYRASSQNSPGTHHCPRLGANSPLPEELAYFDHAALYWYLAPSGRPAAGVRWGGAAAAAIGIAAGPRPALLPIPGTSCLASHAALAASSAVGKATAAGRAASKSTGGVAATAVAAIAGTGLRAASKSTVGAAAAATGAAIDRTAGKGTPPRLGANSPLPEELAYFDHAALYWYLSPSGRTAAGVRWGGAAAAAIGIAAGPRPALAMSCLASHAALAASSLVGIAATAGRAAVTGVRTGACIGRMDGALSPIEGVRPGERPAERERRESMMTSTVA